MLLRLLCAGLALSVALLTTGCTGGPLCNHRGCAQPAVAGSVPIAPAAPCCPGTPGVPPPPAPVGVAPVPAVPAYSVPVAPVAPCR